MKYVYEVYVNPNFPQSNDRLFEYREPDPLVDGAENVGNLMRVVIHTAAAGLAAKAPQNLIMQNASYAERGLQDWNNGLGHFGGDNFGFHGGAIKPNQIQSAIDVQEGNDKTITSPEKTQNFDNHWMYGSRVADRVYIVTDRPIKEVQARGIERGAWFHSVTEAKRFARERDERFFNKPTAGIEVDKSDYARRVGFTQSDDYQYEASAQALGQSLVHSRSAASHSPPTSHGAKTSSSVSEPTPLPHETYAKGSVSRSPWLSREHDAADEPKQEGVARPNNATRRSAQAAPRNLTPKQAAQIVNYEPTFSALDVTKQLVVLGQATKDLPVDEQLQHFKTAQANGLDVEQASKSSVDGHMIFRSLLLKRTGREIERRHESSGNGEAVDVKAKSDIDVKVKASADLKTPAADSSDGPTSPGNSR